MVEITSEEQNKVRKMKRADDSLRELWDHVKHTNIRIREIPEEEEKENKTKKLSTNLTLYEAYTKDWTNLRRAETKRKKEFNLQGNNSTFLEVRERRPQTK